MVNRTLSRSLATLVISITALPACMDAYESGELAVTTAALTAEQCTWFQANDKVTICHATGNAKNPYVIIRTNTEGCAEGHADHGDDYVSSSDPASPLYDPTCQGLGCLPEGAPADSTIACCDGLESDGLTCVAVGCPDVSQQADPVAFAGPVSGASDVVYDDAGAMYISGYFSNEVRRVDVPGSGSGTVVLTGASPLGLTRDTAGTIYVGFYGSGTIYRHDPATGDSALLATGLCGPAGMTVGPDGALYVGSRDCFRVYRVDTATGDVTDFVTGPSAYDVTFDPDGNLFIADWMGNMVWKRTPAGDLSVFADGLSVPVAVTTDQAGRIYVGEISGGGYILRFAPDGTSCPFAKEPGGLRAGLAFDSTGHLVVSNINDGLVYRLSPPVP